MAFGKTRPGANPVPGLDMKRENLIFGIVFSIIILLSMLVVWPFVSSIVLAGVLTYTLFPAYAFFRDRTGHPRISSGLTILLALVLLVLPAFLVAQRLAGEVRGVFTTIELSNLDRLGDYLSGLTGNQIDFQELLTSSFSALQESIVGLAPDVLGSFTDILLGLFVMFFVMYYAFRDGEGFLRHVKNMLPLDAILRERLFSEVQTVTQGVLYGQVLTAVIQGSVATFGYIIFGVSNWAFWGAVTMVLAFLPLIGTPIIWVPLAVTMLLDGQFGIGIGLMVYGTLVVTNVDNLVRPKLVSERSKVHPVLVIIGVLGGLKMVGFSGMLVGPLILALLVALVKFFEDVYLKDAKLAA